MAKYRRTLLSVGALLAATILVADAQQQPQPTVVLPMGPPRERGASITPAFEGWYKNDDGSFSLLVGYYNRNAKEPLTIPIGPNNRIEPGDPDQGQPTYFEVGRQWGVFVIKVPKDFGNKSIKWTIIVEWRNAVHSLDLESRAIRSRRTRNSACSTSRRC